MGIYVNEANEMALFHSVCLACFGTDEELMKKKNRRCSDFYRIRLVPMTHTQPRKGESNGRTPLRKSLARENRPMCQTCPACVKRDCSDRGSASPVLARFNGDSNFSFVLSWETSKSVVSPELIEPVA